MLIMLAQGSLTFLSDIIRINVVASRYLLVSRNIISEKIILTIVSYTFKEHKLEDAFDTNCIGFLFYFLILKL